MDYAAFFSRPLEALRLVATRRGGWLLVPLLLYSWTLTGPFLFDDLGMVLKCERYSAGERDRLDLFRFAATEDAWHDLVSRGNLPWWMPPRRIDFFRPLAEASFYLDTLLFGRWAAGHRASSLLWFAVALLCARRLYVAADGDHTRAAVATLLFGASQSVAQPVTFICNRSDLFALAGTALAGWAFLANRSRGTVRRAFAGLAAFVVALLAKEIAIGLAAVLAVYWLVRLRDRDSRSPPSESTAVALLCALIAAAYLGYYAWSRPWFFEPGGGEPALSRAAHAVQASLLYLSSWTLGVPISALLVAPDWVSIMVAAAGGAAALVLIRRGAPYARGGRGATFFAVWAGVFLVVALAATVETRSLCLATAGWAYLLAGLLVPTEGRRPAPLWLRHWLLIANLTIGVPAAVGSVIVSFRAEAEARRRLIHYADGLVPPLRDGDRLIVPQPASVLELVCAGDRLEYLTGRRDVGVIFLCPPASGAVVSPDDENTLTVRTIAGPVPGSSENPLALATLRRRHRTGPLACRDFTVEPCAESGTEIRFRFNGPLVGGRFRLANAVAPGRAAKQGRRAIAPRRSDRARGEH